MPDPDNDPIRAAFTNFRIRETPMIKPPGLSSVHARIRHRRRAHVAMTAVATAIAIIVPAAGYAAYTTHRHAPPSSTGASSTLTTIPGTPSAAQTPPSQIPPSSGAPTQTTSCRAAQLTGTVTDSGSTSSQPFVIIALTNTSASACQLTGYPRLTVTGYIGQPSATSGILPVSVTDGAIYERSDPGPSRVELPPQSSASFALGTSTAYQGGANGCTITHLQIAVPGDQTSIPVTANIGATRPAGQPFPITVTAFVAGRSGPP